MEARSQEKGIENALLNLIIAARGYVRAADEMTNQHDSELERIQAESDFVWTGQALDDALKAARQVLGINDTGRRPGRCQCCEKETIFLYQGIQSGIEEISSFTMWTCSVCSNVVSGRTIGLDPAEEQRLIDDAKVLA